MAQETEVSRRSCRGLQQSGLHVDETASDTCLATRGTVPTGQVQ